MYDTIIFDCDGTLTDSEYLNNKANADLLAEYGYPQYTVGYAMDHFVGMTMGAIRKVIEAEQKTKLPEDYIETYISRVPEYQKKYLKSVDGAVDAVYLLEESFKTCVASNGEQSNVVESLKVIGLFDIWGEERIFTKVQVQRGKPAPDLFLLAAEKLGSDPASCIVIEDSPAGVQAGLAAGMHVIGFVGASHNPLASRAKLQQAGAHAICDHWGEIVHYIKGLTEVKEAL